MCILVSPVCHLGSTTSRTTSCVYIIIRVGFSLVKWKGFTLLGDLADSTVPSESRFVAIYWFASNKNRGWSRPPFFDGIGYGHGGWRSVDVLSGRGRDKDDRERTWSLNVVLWWQICNVHFAEIGCMVFYKQYVMKTWWFCAIPHQLSSCGYTLSLSCWLFAVYTRGLL